MIISPPDDHIEWPDAKYDRGLGVLISGTERVACTRFEYMSL